MRKLSETLLCLSVIMICICCFIQSIRITRLEQEITKLNIAVASATDAQEEIKRMVDANALNTDAQIQQINNDLKEEIKNSINELKEPDDDEIEIVVNEKPIEKAVELPITNEPEPESIDEPVVDVETPVVEEEVENEVSVARDSNYIGSYEITAYTWTGNSCADGEFPQSGHTAACNDPSLWHQWVYIEGYGSVYIHDTGGMASNVIDIYMDSESECINWGRQVRNVYWSE